MTRLARPDPEARHFGAIVRRLRHRNGWTLSELGAAAKMNSRYLGFLERGQNVPSLSVVLHLARVLGVDAAEMITEVIAESRRADP